MSLLFSQHNNMQSTRRMSSSSSNSGSESGQTYHAIPSPAAWWNYENQSFGTQNFAAAPIYSDSPINSPYTQSPHIDASLTMLPYSPSLPPMQSRARIQPEFAFPPSNSVLPSHQKHWRGHVEPQIYGTPSVQTSPQWPIEPFDSNSWNEMILSALEADAAPSPASSQYTLPSPPSLRYLLPCPSPAPSLSSSGRLSPTSSTASSPSTSSSCSGLRVSIIAPNVKTCSHCSSTRTPLWRRDPTTHLPLCNACGLYLQQRNRMRPAALIAADQAGDEPEGDAGPGAGDGPECSHCHTHRTSVWRRSKTGAKLCNACGVYARLRGRDRPLSLRRNKIRPRCKHPK
ncbi:hypothetical protein C8R44DRAFT_984689 [Mycena epipterygia]|nr:hypothetical protein C8R44DRAFT_984689 [Mycena epipterygia]